MRTLSWDRSFARAQAAYDAMEAPECYEPEPPEVDDAEDPVCILGELACRACGQTGNGHYPYQGTGDLKCDACRGRGVVPCPGCSECGRGETEVFDV